MKKLLLIALVPFILSCDVYFIEPVYDSRDPVVGYYQVDEYSETYNEVTHYTIHITKSSTGSEIYLNNFYGMDLRVRAYVERDKITIPFQTKGGYEIQGVGTYYGSSIELNYSVKDIYSCACTDFCETTAWRDY
ncbi:MAG: hypothetical protein L0Y35_04080 [Flammeovirgaceae bacterium]|nr:hypothetical protein [Flammeovirgaceae bacterium]